MNIYIYLFLLNIVCRYSTSLKITRLLPAECCSELFTFKQTFDVLICPLSVTERFLLQPFLCGTVFHRTSLPPPSPSSAVVLNHICSHFLIPLSDSSLIYTVPVQ